MLNLSFGKYDCKCGIGFCKSLVKLVLTLKRFNNLKRFINYVNIVSKTIHTGILYKNGLN